MRQASFIWLCGITILLGAFLLFQVQPTISKMILPWFGGGPAVWTVCMLFFQVVLLGGYAYAHLMIRMRNPKTAMLLHLAVLMAALLTLPITPEPDWKPIDGTQPTVRILALLAACVGIPYFALSSTGPLVQGWYYRVTARPQPYRLYALSNLGSLGALLTFPFVFEPSFTTTVLGRLWSVLFAVFACLFGFLAVQTYRVVRGRAVGKTPEVTAPHEKTAPTLDQRMIYLLLPALASVMLLAVTNHLSQDVAVVPFFWVIPLSLYLLSFILCFDSKFWYRRQFTAWVTVLMVLAISVLVLEYEVEWFFRQLSIEVDLSDFLHELAAEAALYLLLLFAVCMLCHGEVVRVAPVAERLTAFYLMIAAGGALGGIFVALVCPQIFRTHVELGVAVVAAFMLAVGTIWDALWKTWLLRTQFGKFLATMLVFPLLFFVVRGQFEAASTADDLATVRNFYGVLSVEERHEDDKDAHIRELYNGRILHGSQFMAETKRSMPTTYYSTDSGVGLTLRRLGRRQPRLRVAVVGLGSGTLATYGRPGDSYTFYELNPHVVGFANEYFTFLEDSAAQIRIIMGDARLSMERQDSQNYDVLVLDAFSGDAIPAHLLTQEAFREYGRHLANRGVIAIHISNRHLDLAPVVGVLAEQFGWRMRGVEHLEDDRVGEASSDWILLSRDNSFFADPVIARESRAVDFEPIQPWTDQYSNLFEIMMW